MLKLSNLSDKFYDKYDKFDHNFIFLLELKKKRYSIYLTKCATIEQDYRKEKSYSKDDYIYLDELEALKIIMYILNKIPNKLIS